MGTIDWEQLCALGTIDWEQLCAQARNMGQLSVIRAQENIFYAKCHLQFILI